MAHTSMDYDCVLERTIPQIEAIISKLGKHIPIKIGIPSESIPQIDVDVKNRKVKAPRLSEIAAFCGDFSGIE